mgnify:CR=1 FL=1
MGQDDTEQVVRKQLKIVRKYPDGLQSYFVDNIVVQHQPDRFILTFFEVWPPAVVGDPAEQKAELDSIDSVEAKCVARLVLTPKTMRQLAKLVAENLANYEKLMQKLQEAGEEE